MVASHPLNEHTLDEEAIYTKLLTTCDSLPGPT